MNNDNIIRFPNNLNSITPLPKGIGPSKEEIEEQIYIAKEFHIEESTNFICQMITEHLNRLGINITDDNDFKDLALIFDSVRSYISKKYDILHILQIFSKDLIDKEEHGYSINLQKMCKMLKSKENKEILEFIRNKLDANS